ncbi:putative Somatomedin-B and thrombospondin type-1 domain-containing protein [Hypsibius exemplaris]|uniref:Somatomedin-B and thrombospondin type-1 domain-containing protein n=1 Tax=Hypsibius exemplaris TaxID=2072580 RepID=A0A1W0X3S7_HYPEX|nr:putative Somatomedin-B and thrombospondin type-1 domain-containing protein [Hypsibius exemplaris]
MDLTFLIAVAVCVHVLLSPQLVDGQWTASDQDARYGDEQMPLGCEARKMCCTGRDSSCVVSEFHPNSIIEDLDTNRTIRCYCDESCLTLGDCCHDLRSFCGVSDCIVSPWGNWSHCSSACGVGKMSRRRQVLQESSNGGRVCPALLQSRACFNNDCTKRQEVREVAAILPGIFGAARGENETFDIRHNLRMNYPKDLQHESSKEYCAYFEVTKASKRCMLEVWSSQFKVGAQVCVECQKGAMRKNIGYRCKGQGLVNTDTRWSAMLVNGCHGKWQLTEKQENCHCDPNDHNSFIFV